MELWSLPKPTIAAVRGWCLAGACELAMACDLIVATDDARFGEPEIRYGSGPVTLLMPFVLGQKKTNELLFTGDAIDAQEAERVGLVNRVVPGDELEAAVAELVRKIAPTPLPVLRLTKLALTRAYEAMGLRAGRATRTSTSRRSSTPPRRPSSAEFDRIVARAGPEGGARLARRALRGVARRLTVGVRGRGRERGSASGGRCSVTGAPCSNGRGAPSFGAIALIRPPPTRRTSHLAEAAEEDHVLDHPRQPVRAVRPLPLDPHALRADHRLDVAAGLDVALLGPQRPLADAGASSSRPSVLVASAAIRFETPRKSATNSVAGSS